MAALPKNANPMLDRLLDGIIEFDQLGLESMPQEDVLALLRAMRGHVLCLTSLIDELSEKMRAVEEFARPRTSRRLINPAYEDILQ